MSCILSKFYIKPQQVDVVRCSVQCCILSKFYIKPQPQRFCSRPEASCILSKFYIKPQLISCCDVEWSVVSYRNSTSNHNSSEVVFDEVVVVSYRNSTSNHNVWRRAQKRRKVVSYRNSTSNHNWRSFIVCNLVLYLIEILHQTTTMAMNRSYEHGCILSKFYIKPQRRPSAKYCYAVVSYRNSTSNHNASFCPDGVL